MERINFDLISRQYATNEIRKDEIIKSLESLPETVETESGTIKVHKLLADLEDLNNESMGICFDIAVKRGFSLAFKLVFHNLTLN